MAGAVTQIISKGVQDESLTDMPMITFWEAVYQQYIDFAMEAIQHTFMGTCDFDRKCTAELTRTGDMMGRMLAEITLPAVTVSNSVGVASFRWSPNIAQTMIKFAGITVGNQEIDKQSGLWMNVWTELTVSESHRNSYLELIGQQVPTETIAYAGGVGTVTYTVSGLQTPKETHAQTKVRVPIKFWCYEPGTAIPTVAMPFAPVRVYLEFRPYSELYVVNNVEASNNSTDYTNKSLVNVSLWVDHIFVDNEDRQRIVDEPHEYLITQVQFPGEHVITAGTTTDRVSLHGNHPAKSIYWVVQRDDAVNSTNRDWTNYLDSNGNNPIVDAKLTANNQDRFARRDGYYFNQWQPLHHHTRAPFGTGVNMYSFALYPEDYQPSGSLNFSRIDNPSLDVTLTAATTVVASGGSASKLYYFILNTNTFRVANGTAGVGFAA